LHWPEIDSLEAKFGHMTRGSALPSPAVGTPFSMTTQNSYFGNHEKKGLRRNLSTKGSTRKKTSARSAIIKPQGWLSRSYLSGLILPGEGLNHFLIATLLENDDHAVQVLGEDANLYGGFVYMSKSYWATACIVGRVLAAGKGASEW
jgi:hypothetical protein